MAPSYCKLVLLALTDITYLKSVFLCCSKTALRKLCHWRKLFSWGNERERREPTEYLHSAVFYNGESKEMCKVLFLKRQYWIGCQNWPICKFGHHNWYWERKKWYRNISTCHIAHVRSRKTCLFFPFGNQLFSPVYFWSNSFERFKLSVWTQIDTILCWWKRIRCWFLWVESVVNLSKWMMMMMELDLMWLIRYSVSCRVYLGRGAALEAAVRLEASVRNSPITGQCFEQLSFYPDREPRRCLLSHLYQNMGTHSVPTPLPAPSRPASLPSRRLREQNWRRRESEWVIFL